MAHERDVAADMKALGDSLRSHCMRIMENCDTVEIVVTKNCADGLTRMAHFGMGNSYARYGAMCDWVLIEDTRTRMATMEEGNDGG